MSVDWFRSPDWSSEAQADFETRLGRARGHNKAQYVRIKGLALHEAGQVDVARSLWLRILAGGGDHDFERAGTLEHLGDSYAQTDPAQAERHYRTLLTDHPSLNGTSHTVEISLAELLIAKGEHAEALALLNSWIERDTAQFPNVLFRWHLALILIAEAQGDQETVQRAARTALDLASRGPSLSTTQGRRRCLSGSQDIEAPRTARSVGTEWTLVARSSACRPALR